jgi:hypothetical protein
LLVVPNPQYLLGYMAFAVFYGILGIDFALAHGLPEGRSHLTAHAKAKAQEQLARERISVLR